MTDIIMVKFIKNGKASGRDYAYITPGAVAVGDIVAVNVKNGKTKGIVTRTNVPTSEIEPFKWKIKTIIGKVNLSCEECQHFIPIGEGDHICEEKEIPLMVLMDYEPTTEYLWCGGTRFVEKPI